jgi:hypothetical protein
MDELGHLRAAGGFSDPGGPSLVGGADEMTHIRHTSGARHFLWTDWHEIVTPKCQALVVDNRTEGDVA